MQERTAHACQILNAGEHLVVRPGARHQQRFRLTLARLQRQTCVTALPREIQTLDICQRFVNHDGPQSRDPMHGHLGANLQVARRWLFNVLKSIERSATESLDALEQVDDIVFVWTLLIEVERQFPLPLRRDVFTDTSHFDNATDIPVDIVTGQLDLQMTYAVRLQPLFERFGIAVIQSRSNVDIGQRIERTDQMIKVQRWSRLGIQKLAWIHLREIQVRGTR